MTSPCDCVRVESPAQLADAARLFRAYADALPFELDFQGFDEELAALPGRYGPPTGSIFLAMRDGDAVGCVGLRALEPGTCEMKRMYVDPAGRGAGVGRTLGEAVIAEARRLGYRRMLLDTVASMTAANALYRALGFRETDAYCENPLEGATFMALDL